MGAQVCCNQETHEEAGVARPLVPNQDELIAKFVDAGQGHIFKAWQRLGQLERENLLTECSQFDVNLINDLFKDLVADKQDAPSQSKDEEISFDTVEQDHVVNADDLSEYQRSIFTSEGNRLIREGRVGVVILAGGQGSRLGFSGPKGKYDIGLPSGKSLFQILTERFFRAQLIANQSTTQVQYLADGTKMPIVPILAQTCTMFVMTSFENHDETVAFFKENNYFGGHADSFVFFPQAMLPAVDTQGKILLQSQSSLKLAPNGNGALFDSLKTNREVQGLISLLEYVQIIGVDNALNKVLDPVQIGFTSSQKLTCSLKSCAKRNAEEKVGVIGKKNGQYNIVEYSEFPAAMASETLADGSLKFNQGHILVFVVEASFLLSLATGDAAESNALYHRANKKIVHLDPETWETVTPTKENGWKFELFLHNFLPMVTQGKLGVLSVNRDQEFAPVKNANGPADQEPLPDTPAYARKMMLSQHNKWLQSAGVRIHPDTKGKIEVSTLFSYEGEGFESLLKDQEGPDENKSLGGMAGYVDEEGKYLQSETLSLRGLTKQQSLF